MRSPSKHITKQIFIFIRYDKQGKYVTLKVSLGVKSFLKNFSRSIFQAQSVSNLSNFCAFNGNDHGDYSEHSPCRF